MKITPTKTGFNIEHTTREVWGIDDPSERPEYQKFLAVMRQELAKYQWAIDDPARLERTLSLCEGTMCGDRKCLIDSPSWLAAWKAIGQKGKPTYKALHALFAGGAQ